MSANVQPATDRVLRTPLEALQSCSTAEEVVASVARLAPLIREHAAAAEQECRLPAVLTDALRDAGLFRMFRPKSLGGLELDPVSAFRVIEAVARIDGAVGWNVGLPNASEVFGSYLDDGTGQEICGWANTVMAGSFNPPRRAVAVDGGYRLSGRTSFNSNCHAATWFIGLAHVYDGDQPRLGSDGSPETVLTFFPSVDATIIENWNTLGMRGTGSHDVELDDVFVPVSRAVPFGPLETPGPAYVGPLYRIATFAAVGCNAVPALGIAQAAIDDLVELGVKVPAYTQRALRDRGDVQTRLARAAGKLGAARTFLHYVYDEAWRTCLDGRKPDMKQRANCQLGVSHAVLAAVEVVDLVHACVGATGIRKEQRFEKYFRDVHVISQHAFVCESRLDSVGQVMLDLDPDWPFFYM